MPALDMDIAGLLKRIQQAKANQSSWMADGDENSGYIGGYRLPGESMYFSGSSPNYGTYKADGLSVFDDGQGLYAYKDIDGSGIDYNNAPRDRYDYSGKYLGSDNWTDIGDADDTARMVAALGAGGMFGAGALAGSLGGAGGAAGGMAGGAAEAIPGFSWEALASGVPETFGAGSAITPEMIAGAGAVGGAGGAGGAASIPGLLSSPPVVSGFGAPAAAGAVGGGGSMLGGLSGLLGGGGGLGALATAAGGLLGSQGEKEQTTAEKSLPGFLQGPVAGQLVPGAMGLLDAQRQATADQSASMIGKGAQLMGSPVAGNGVGAVTLHNPSSSPNPYQQSMLDELQRRSGDLIGQQVNQIAGRQVSAGGMGSTRQGVAQGQAIAQGQDQFLGHAANLMGGLYESDMGRAMTRYGIDNQMYDSQRKTDLAQAGLGAGMVGQGFDQAWSPFKNATSVLQPFTGYGTATQSQQQGGGATGLVGGALGAAQWAKNMGLFGGESGGSSGQTKGWW